MAIGRFSGAAALLRRHAFKTVALLAALVLLALAGPRLLAGPRVAVHAVIARDFVQSVVASGRVQAPHRIDVGVQITGTVARVPVAEGQSVATGTVLIELEDSEARAALRQAQIAVEQAALRLRQMRELQSPVAEQAQLQAQANHENARRALARSRDLFDKGFIGQAALDEAQRAERVAQTQLQTAQKQLDSARPGGADVALAQAALAQARAAADAAQARLRYATIAAPVAGTLIKRDVEPGDVVQPGRQLLVLSPDGETQLVVQIDEKNLHLIRLGQAALASADAYPQQRFDAELVYINPGVDAQRGSVEVKLRVPRPPAYLRQDMTVSVDIAVAHAADALLAPADAIHDADGATPWVFKVEAGRVRRQPVRIGLRSGGLCQILEGLRAGDQLIPAGSAQVREGERIRPLASATAP